MTQDIEISAFNHVMVILTESGFDGMADAMAVLMNEAMKLDRDHHLSTGPCPVCQPESIHSLSGIMYISG